MSSKIIFIVIAVVVAGGGTYVAMNNSGEQRAETGNAGTEQEMRDENTEQERIEDVSGSFSDLLSIGKNVTCTFQHSDETGMAEGTVYVAGAQNKMRGNFTYDATDAGQAFDGGMIHDNGTVYTWGNTPEGRFGMKMEVEGTNLEEVYNSEEFEGQGFDPTTEVEYDCSSWNVDQSMFTPPSDVEFTDLSAQMQQMQEAFQGGGGMDCSMCESIPDESAKAQCLQSLQCE